MDKGPNASHGATFSRLLTAGVKGVLCLKEVRTYVVNDVCLRLRPLFLRVGRADQVHLIVLELIVASVHVDDVVRIVYPESVEREEKMKLEAGKKTACQTAKTWSSRPGIL